MSDANDSEPRRPLFVQIALWGIKTRQVAMIFVWLCLALAVASAIARFWFGLLLLIAGWWYWLALRWVDKNGGWK